MCGRYKYEVIADEVIKIFKLKNITLDSYFRNSNLRKDNISPTDSILTIRKNHKTLALNDMNWGIKFSEKSPLIFNSRIETVSSKANWKTMFERNRAVIPMTGFYEWQVVNKRKEKKTISLPDEDIFYVPALYQEKNDHLFASLITVPPNDFMKPIHNRMPAILKIDDAIKIMEAGVDEALEMCRPYNGEMKVVDSNLKTRLLVEELSNYGFSAKFYKEQRETAITGKFDVFVIELFRNGELFEKAFSKESYEEATIHIYNTFKFRKII